MERLLIVDGHAYAYRAYYAIRSMRSPSGSPTNAIYGFIKMLVKMRARVEPTRLLVAWDGGLDAGRVAAWPEYKAQRPEMPADLAGQLDDLMEYLRAAGVASFCEAGVEADDYIACVARRAAAAGWAVVIASSDKDFMQLVSPEVGSWKSEAGSRTSDFGPPTSDLGPRTSAGGRIGLLNPNDKSEAIWTAAEVRVKSGVEPGQIVDWLALVGDAVDNIPGVPGVGPKTAAELLGQLGSVAGIYARLGEVKSERVRGALAGAAGAVRRNVELVRLQAELPYAVELDGLREQPVDVDALREMYARWGFRSLLAELETSRQEVLL